MTPDCQRWTNLSDRLAVGQLLAEEEGAFLRAHTQRCDECSREATAWHALMTLSPADDVPSDAEVAAVLAGVSEAASRDRRRSRGRWAAASAGALALAAGVSLWIARNRQHTTDAAPPVAIRAPAPPAPVSEPTASPRPKPGRGGVQAAQSACSELVPGILACTAPDSVITRRELGSKQRLLELGHGRVIASLMPQPKGASFSIVTSAGRVTAVGTVFSVEARPDGSTTARVLVGKVAVLVTGAVRPQFVRAGEALRLGDARPSLLTAEERERELALLPADLEASLDHAGTDATAGNVAARPASVESLLEEALALRERGEFRRAADAYRRIHELSPASAIGGTALVSLGELSLSSLGDPASALAAFDAYLTRGGALSQEAEFGKARALRALHRTDEERRTIEQFLARYPDAEQSRVLRRRLGALGP